MLGIILLRKVGGKDDGGVGEPVFSDFPQKKIQLLSALHSDLQQDIIQTDDMVMFDDSRMPRAELTKALIIAGRKG